MKNVADTNLAGHFMARALSADVFQGSVMGALFLWGWFIGMLGVCSAIGMLGVCSVIGMLGDGAVGCVGCIEFSGYVSVEGDGGLGHVGGDPEHADIAGEDA